MVNIVSFLFLKNLNEKKQILTSAIIFFSARSFWDGLLEKTLKQN